MRPWLIIFSICMSAILVGCTTTPVVRSEVTTFHEWPSNLQHATYAFEPGPKQQNNLEYRAYQSLIQEALDKLGFRAASTGTAAQIKVKFQYGMDARDMRVVDQVPVDPAFYYPLYSPYWGSPYWGSPFGGYGGFGDPFWPYTYTEPREFQYVLYTRRLNIKLIQASDNRDLFDVNVVSEGRNGNLASVMPYLVQSAFKDFPGTSGVPRRIELPTGQEKTFSTEHHLSAH